LRLDHPDGLYDPDAYFCKLAEQCQRIGHTPFNSLSQTVIKLTVPGVPDIFQGCELWNFSLVNPDNRRPVDFGHCQTLLDSLQPLPTLESQHRSARVRALCDESEDGRAKLLVVNTALTLRQSWPEVFQAGCYLALAIKGKQATCLCAYARITGQRIVITVAPRFLARLQEEAGDLPLGEKIWGNTTVDLPFHQRDNQYTCAFTGKILKPQQHFSKWRLPAAEILAEFPVGFILCERNAIQ